MSPTVRLEEILEALESPDEWECYVDRNTGAVIVITENESPYVARDFVDVVEEDVSDLPEWLRDSILQLRRALESADLLALPSQFDLHEWEIMRRFSDSQPESARAKLMHAIHGRGAFRAFRSTVDALELRDDWFKFRENAVRQFATDWLNDNGFAVSE